MPAAKVPAEKARSRPDKGFMVGSPMESESLYKSPYYPDSYYFPFNPDPLCRGNNYDIYDEMADDDQVKVAVSLKKDLVVNSGWTIECDDKDIALEITDGLKAMEQNGRLDMAFEDILRGIVSSAYSYGFSLCEPVWRIEDSKYQYDTVKVRPPHTFRFDINDRGDINNIFQSTNKGDISFQPDKFIHYAYQSDFGNPYGMSDFRAAHNPWKAKKFVNKFLAIYLERYAGPTVVGKFSPNADTDQISRLHTILSTIQQKTVMAIPDDCSVEFVQANRDASDVYIRALHYYNMMIGRALLVPDLMGVSGDKTGGGSYSLGSEQFKLFMSCIDKDRTALARKITLRLVKPLVHANYGDIKCEFKFLPYGSENNTEFLKIWSEAVKGRIFKPNEEEINYLRKQLKFPEGKVEVEPQVIPTPDQDKSQPNTESTGIAEPAREKVREYRFRRDFTLHERKVDFEKVQETLRSSGDGISKELARILERGAKDLLQQAKDKGILENFLPERIEELQPKFRKELNDSFRGHFVSLFRDGLEEAAKELRCAEKKFVEDEIIPEEFERIIRAEAFKLTGEMSENVRKRVANKIFEGIKNGQSYADVGRSVFSDLKKYTDSQLKTIVHTKTTEVMNAARKTFFDSDPIASRLIVGYQYSAILDETTTEVCRFLDQKVFSTEEDLARLTPPLHWNAIVAGEKVLTINGYKPIEEIRVGDKVMSHRGRWCVVYDTMKKKNSDWGFALELGTDYGRVLLTPDHPVLAEGYWTPAGSLRIGDHIFKSNAEPADSGLCGHGLIPNAQDSISKVRDNLSPCSPLSLSVSGTICTYLKNYLLAINKRIEQIGTFLNLTPIFYSPRLKKAVKFLFRFRWFTPKFISNGEGHTHPDFRISGRFVPIHGFRASKVLGRVKFGLTESRVDVARVGPDFGKRKARCLPLTSVLDPEFPEPTDEYISAGKAKGLCNKPKGFSFSKMALLDHGVKNDGVLSIHEQDYTTFNTGIVVKSIGQVPYSGMVYNLAVADDESYVANGVVVHNCRSLLVPVTSFEHPKFDKIPSLGGLEKRGANLLSKSSGFRRLSHMEQHSEEPLTGSFKLNEFGDHILVPPPGDGLFIKVLKLSCNNAHPSHPVTIGFKSGIGALHYVSTLERSIGRYDEDFGDTGWILPEGEPLIINLSSADSQLYATCRYVIVDKLGGRVR